MSPGTRRASPRPRAREAAGHPAGSDPPPASCGAPARHCRPARARPGRPTGSRPRGHWAACVNLFVAPSLEHVSDFIPRCLPRGRGRRARRFCHRIIAARCDRCHTIGRRGRLCSNWFSRRMVLMPSARPGGPGWDGCHLTQNPLEERLKHSNPRSVVPSSSRTMSRGSSRLSSRSIASGIDIAGVTVTGSVCA